MKIQDSSDLLSEGPAELIDRPLAEYAALLRGTGELRSEHLDAVDYALRHKVVRLLARAAGEEELEATYEEMRRLVPVAKETELAAWVPRWRAFADLLEARLAALTTRDVEGARRLAHAAGILALVEEEPGLTQAEICRHLKLKPANLSRILGVLEAHELIERRSTGRERRVHPGRLAGAPPAAPAEPSPPVEDELPRGMAFLFKVA
jgi:MarR family